MPPAHNVPVNPDTLITVKAHFDGENRRFKVPLRDLGAHTFPQRIRRLLNIPPGTDVVLRRYSDSAGEFLTLDSEHPAVYKQLYRAAKAKLKLRIHVDRVQPEPEPEMPEKPEVIVEPAPEPEVLQEPKATGYTPEPVETGPEKMSSPRASYLETVLHRHEPSPSPPVRTCRITPLPPLPANTSTATYSCAILIDCNRCKASIPNEHYHCNVCEEGDYDLCQECIDAGHLCPAGTHWLIKRFLVDGQLVTSTTEIVGPKFTKSTKSEEPLPEQDCAVPQYKPEPVALLEPEMPEPSEPVKDTYVIHSALCDVCDCRIMGARYKCLDCPNWDVCAACIGDVKYTHPSHRFVPLFLPIAPRTSHTEVHTGVYCNGAHCQDKMGQEYITGVRYKCVVCHDTDFCETCEAHPNSTHNNTHPLLKFKSAVKHVSVSAYGENDKGEVMERMGDRDGPETKIGSVKSAATETIPPFISNAATQVHPPMSLDAFYDDSEQEITYKKQEVIEEKEVVNQPASEYESVASSPAPAEDAHKVTAGGLNPFGLHTRFVCDTIPDSHPFPPNAVFTKTWTLHNPGPSAWPAGTSARFVGGDAMFNVDTSHAISLSSLVSAMESQHLSEPVYPGQQAEFTVQMKAPTRPGKAISYWRLKSGDGVAFGHKLWCDITVTEQTAGVIEKKGEMVFPTLEKESPVASVHETQSKHNPDADDVSDSASTLNDEMDAPVEVVDLAAEVDSLTLDIENTEEDDESFLTDEEYDILDASDEEFAEVAKASERK
ncbi:hypothetical protein McanMca71_003132 [Microsporum canis]